MTALVSVLPNGLRVVTDAMPELESVSLGVYVGVGAMYEPKDLNGISHLLEHMAFKGTTTRSAREIAEEIEDVGGYINACTARETTSYYIKVLKEDVPLAVDILSDILQNSTFDAEEFAREKTVVLQEISQSADTPDDIIFDYFQSKAYPDQAIGRAILGTAETVNAVTRETLDHFMKTNYTPSRMIVSASGNVDHESFVNLVFRSFGDLKPAEGLKADPAVYCGGEHRENRDIEQVNLLLGFPGVSFYDKDYYTAQLFSTLFGGGMSSRLFQEIREKKGLVYSIYSFSSSYSTGGTIGVYAGTGEQEAAEVLPAVCREIKRLYDGVTEEELNRAKAQLKAGILMSLEHPSARSEQNAGHLLVFGKVLGKDEILEKIAAVSTQDILSLCERVFTGTPTLAVLGPSGNVPSYESVANMLARD